MAHIKAMLKEHAILIVSLLMVALIIMAVTVYNQSTSKYEYLSRIQALERDLTLKSGEAFTLSQDKEALIKQVAQTAVEYEALLDEQKLELETIKNQLELSYTLPEHYISYLSQNGFGSPSELLETLIGQNDLIPVEGVLGGTMRWVPSDSIVLNDQYVFGIFEDGHIMGYGLLKYSFNANSNVVWELIDTYSD